MACWFDLPPELRKKIFAYLFSDKTYYHVRQTEWGFQHECQVVTLILASKLFACSSGLVIETMLSESVLRLRPYFYMPLPQPQRSPLDSRLSLCRLPATSTLSELGHVMRPVRWIRRLEMYAPVNADIDLNAAKLLDSLPNLKELRIRLEDADSQFPPLSTLVNVADKFVKLAGTVLDGNIRSDKDRTWQEMILNSVLESVCYESKSAIFEKEANAADRNTCDWPQPDKQVQFVSRKQDEDVIDPRAPWARLISDTIERAYQGTAAEAKRQAKWVASLLMDDQVRVGRVNIVTTWRMHIYFVGTGLTRLTGQKDLARIRPAFFGTKDMCLRFVHGSTVFIIPQTFSQKLIDTVNS